MALNGKKVDQMVKIYISFTKKPNSIQTYSLLR